MMSRRFRKFTYRLRAGTKVTLKHLAATFYHPTEDNELFMILCGLANGTWMYFTIDQIMKTSHFFDKMMKFMQPYAWESLLVGFAVVALVGVVTQACILRGIGQIGIMLTHALTSEAIWSGKGIALLPVEFTLLAAFGFLTCVNVAVVHPWRFFFCVDRS